MTLLALIIAIANPYVYEKPINVNSSVEYNFVLPLKEEHSEIITYDELINEAIYNCRGIKPDKVDPRLLEKLIKIESSFHPPAAMKGMVLAAACMESKYNPRAKGDRKFSKDKKTPMAIGILQQWPVYEKRYGTVRTDPESAARSWMKHIVKQIPKVKRMCGYKTDKKIWLAAWVTGVRYKKPGGRCREAPLHYRLLKRWHRNIKKQRDWKMSCVEDGDGC